MSNVLVCTSLPNQSTKYLARMLIFRLLLFMSSSYVVLHIFQCISSWTIGELNNEISIFLSHFTAVSNLFTVQIAKQPKVQAIKIDEK